MNITLTPDIEQFVTTLAKKQGTDAESVVLKALRECFFLKEKIQKKTADPPKNLADLLTGYVGCIDSSGTAEECVSLSENSGQRFAELLHKKQRQGKI
jgi:hypothetical protein